MPFDLTRRKLLGCAGATFASALSFPAVAHNTDGSVTFVFISDVHACRMATGLSPNCQQEGKTDENLLRHISALNALPDKVWPETIDGKTSGLSAAGKPVGAPRGVVLGGDMTDDGGGQTINPGEGMQLLQFSHRYSEGAGPDRLHFPVYAGLGNHDLDQDGPPGHVDWYRQELRNYVEVNHEKSAFFKPPVPAGNFDPDSDAYSWDWADLHLIQLHRFGGDTRKGAASALSWLADDLRANAGGKRPVVIFQHYGWDNFSTERWDPTVHEFDDSGAGSAHWWSPEDQGALLKAISGVNVVALFHGHEHPTPMIYGHSGLTLVKPKASFMGGFAVARLENGLLDIALGEAIDGHGGIKFTNAMSKAV